MNINKLPQILRDHVYDRLQAHNCEDESFEYISKDDFIELLLFAYEAGKKVTAKEHKKLVWKKIQSRYTARTLYGIFIIHIPYGNNLVYILSSKDFGILKKFATFEEAQESAQKCYNERLKKDETFF